LLFNATQDRDARVSRAPNHQVRVTTRDGAQVVEIVVVPRAFTDPEGLASGDPARASIVDFAASEPAHQALSAVLRRLLPHG
jgi:hypothetical protein